MPPSHSMTFRLAALTLALAGTAAAQPLQFSHLTPEDGLSQSIVYSIWQEAAGPLWFGTRDGLNRYDGYGFRIYRRVPGEGTSISDNRISAILGTPDRHVWIGTRDGGLNLFDRRTETFRAFRHDPGDASSLSLDWVSALATSGDGTLWVGTLGAGLNRFTGEGFERFTARTAGLPDDRVTALARDGQGQLWVATRSGLCRWSGRQCAAAPAPLSSIAVEALHVDDSGHILAGTAGPALYRLAPDGRTVTLLAEAPPTPRGGAFIAVRGDPEGVLWAATAESLYRYVANGNGTGRLAPQSLPVDESAPNTITSLHLDAAGSLWVGTETGVFGLHGLGGRFGLMRHDPSEPNTLSSNRVNAAALTPDGVLWVGTGNGLNRVDRRRGTVERFSTVGVLPDPRIWTLLADRNGRLWVGTGGGGLYHFQNGRFEQVEFVAEPQPGQRGNVNRIRALHQDRRGNVWVGTSFGMYRIDAAQAAAGSRSPQAEAFYRLPGSPTGLPHNFVNAIYESRSGHIWVGTDGGIARLDPASRRVQAYMHDPADPASLPENIVWSLSESRDGAMWIGTVGGGLARFDGNAFETLTEEDGLTSNAVYGILVDNSGFLWVSTGAGLTVYDPQTRAVVGRYDAGDGLQGDEFSLMAKYRSPQGELFFGGDGGLNAFYPERARAGGAATFVAISEVSLLDGRRAGLVAAGDTLTLRHDQNFFEVRFAARDLVNPMKNRYRYRLIGIDPDWREADGRRPVAAYTDVPPGTYRFEVRGTTADGVFAEEGTILTVVIVPALYQARWFQLLVGLIAIGLLCGGVYLLWSRERDLGARRLSEEREVRLALTTARAAGQVSLGRRLAEGPIRALDTVDHKLELAAMTGDREKVREARSDVGNVSKDLRRLAADLRPSAAGRRPLVDALESLVETYRTAQPKVEIILLDEVPAEVLSALSEESQVHLFAIAEEALANATRHGEPSVVRLSLTGSAGNLLLEIYDDGCGFRLPLSRDLARAGKRGLLTAMEHAAALGSSLEIVSGPGEGCTIRTTVSEMGSTEGRVLTEGSLKPKVASKE